MKNFVELAIFEKPYSFNTNSKSIIQVYCIEILCSSFKFTYVHESNSYKSSEF